jgi:streptogramin lyase
MRNHRLFFALATIALTACSGGGGSATPPANPAHPAAKTATASIRLLVPGQSGTASAKRRHALFVASTTAGLTVSVFTSPRAQHPTAIAQASFDVSASSPNCTTTANGRTCTLVIPLPATGTDDFVLTSFDAAPQSGTIPTAAHQLGIGMDAGVAIAIGSNAVSFTLDGVVAAAAVQLPAPSLNALVNGAQSVNVQALDADQNTIVTDAYVDANGNPVSIALAVAGSASSMFQIQPASISAPAPSGVTLTYTGTNLTSSEFKNGFSIDVTATPSNTALATTSALTAQAPFTAFLVLSASLPDEPQGITVGSDGALWFSEAIPNAVARVTLQGTLTRVTVPTSNADPVGITTGPDGNLWFAEASGQNIGTVNVTTLAVREFAVPPVGAFSANPLSIATGSDGNLWFTECNTSMIGRINPSTQVITSFNTPTSHVVPNRIVRGPDGNMWFTETNNNAIGRVTTSGVITEFPVPTANAVPFDITVGPDGALWFTEEALVAVGRITTSGAISQFPIVAGGGFSGTDTVTTGGDGNLWIGANGALIRAVPNIVPGNAPTFTVFAAGSGGPITGMVMGPNGDVFAVDEDAPAIDRIAL